MKTPVSKSNVFNTVPALNISRDFGVLQIILSPTYIAQLCFYLCCRIISIFQSVRQGMFWDWCGKEVWQIYKGRRKCLFSKMLYFPWGFAEFILLPSETYWMLFGKYGYLIQGEKDNIFLEKYVLNYFKYKESPIQP